MNSVFFVGDAWDVVCDPLCFAMLYVFGMLLWNLMQKRERRSRRQPVEAGEEG